MNAPNLREQMNIGDLLEGGTSLAEDGLGFGKNESSGRNRALNSASYACAVLPQWGPTDAKGLPYAYITRLDCVCAVFPVFVICGGGDRIENGSFSDSNFCLFSTFLDLGV